MAFIGSIAGPGGTKNVHMKEAMDQHTNANGDDGMYTAIANSYMCP